MKQFEYTIDGKKHFQRELVLAQIRQLAVVMQPLGLPDTLGIGTLIVLLADQAPAAAACVLRDENGTIPWMRVEMIGPLPCITVDTDKFAAFTMQIAAGLTPEIVAKAVEDFFDCNPIASLLERLNGMTEKITGAMATMKVKSPLNTSSASSPEETSPKETPSSGATPSPTAKPI
jgi:hypothetical protein